MAELTDAEVRESYPEMLDVLVSVCRGLLLLPLDQMAAANERFQTIAPIVDPTKAMRRGMDNLRDQRRVIDAAAQLRRVLVSLDKRSGGDTAQ